MVAMHVGNYIHKILWLSDDSFVFNFCGSAFWVIYFYPVSILSVQSGSNNGWSPYSNLGWSLGAVWRTESPWFQNIVRVSCGLGIGARVFYSRMLEMYWVGLCVDFPSNQISIIIRAHWETPRSDAIPFLASFPVSELPSKIAKPVKIP